MHCYENSSLEAIKYKSSPKFFKAIEMVENSKILSKLMSKVPNPS